jgi:CO/xanthine dehydrogenase Mo-binding subunit
VDVIVTEDSPCPLKPLGVRCAGEAGVGAAVANAISDALGREVTRPPLPADRVRELAGEVVG